MKFQTAESVTLGHPDKLSDYIADRILDECLKQDPESRVACEVMLSHEVMMVAGEITTKAKVDYQQIAENAIKEAGYEPPESFVDDIVEQSPDINQAVNEDQSKAQGAGDQGIMYGYHLKNRMTWKFDMIVIDESSSFKSHDSQRFKALRKVTKYAKRVVLLTGTPDPNGLLDLWSQAYLLDEGERLGKTITAYRDRYFRPGRRNGNVIYEYLPKAGAKEAIFDTLKDIMVSLSAKDHLRMPERIDNVIKIKMPAAARAKYDQMEEDSILELEKADVVAGNKAAVTNKLLQMANGAVYYEDLIPGEDGELETVRKVEWIHDAKLDALEQIVEDSAGQPIMVFYSYQHDCERLMKRFAKYNPGTIKDRESIAAWNAGKVKLLIAHPASMGHGLNLQAGGNIIVWFGVPNNLEYYLQANARLYRQGQQQTVVINHLLMENTHDMDVMESLTQKKVNQDELIAAVKARIAERKGSSGNK